MIDEYDVQLEEKEEGYVKNSEISLQTCCMAAAII